MKDITEKTMKYLMEKVLKEDIKPDEALKFSQAALNLAHALITYSNIKNN